MSKQYGLPTRYLKTLQNNHTPIAIKYRQHMSSDTPPPHLAAEVISTQTLAAEVISMQV
jgi:hypothetical protein